MTVRHSALIASLALGLSAAALPAAAETPAERTPEACGFASLCSTATALDVNRQGWRVRGLRGDRPARFACDTNGSHCRYTRDYFISDDGNAQYVPGGGKPVADD
jgi:hypothetical protein